ncbi:Uncharacterised protein [Mycobacteroides abscessus subsp. abscessus]|nr:Uncharacterised protein [Mycobacteroides abscessus subsp. abscessus]
MSPASRCTQSALRSARTVFGACPGLMATKRPARSVTRAVPSGAVTISQG